MISFIMTLADGDAKSLLEKLFYEHSGRMYHTAYKLLENKQDAEDAVQETFIKIYGNIARFALLEGDELILLIIIYTRNTARDMLRRRNVRLKHSRELVFDNDDEQYTADIPDPDSDVEEIVITKERIKRTREMIDSLPQAQKDAILLKYRYGMREKEIASILGISETAVSSRILRAKNSLREMIGTDI